MTTDLLVVGAGPAGLAAATIAATAGLTVTVLDPRPGPIDKACGEGLMPGAVRALAALGVRPRGRAFTGIRYVDRGHTAQARFPDGEGLGVRRTELHRAMEERARATGVRIEREAVHELREVDGGILANGRPARYLLGADGLHSRVRALAGIHATARGRHRYGIRRHYVCEPWSDLVEVHWCRRGELYVTPLTDGLIGVAALGQRGTRVDDLLAELPELRARLAGSEVSSSDRGAGPLRQDVARRTSGRVLLLGDAAGYVDALTGEGLRLAAEEASAVVEAVLADDPARYEERWHAITRRYRRSTRVLLAATAVPPVRRALVPAAARAPGLFSRCVAAVGG